MLRPGTRVSKIISASNESKSNLAINKSKSWATLRARSYPAAKVDVFLWFLSNSELNFREILCEFQNKKNIYQMYKDSAGYTLIIPRNISFHCKQVVRVPLLWKYPSA